ncbi:MAG TPA: hypothetical protein VFS05_11045 [Gemmatimonadaceae bacterium]|nr:hypothetical protein [Gemmatimonadaceae bacterium]
MEPIQASEERVRAGRGRRIGRAAMVDAGRMVTHDVVRRHGVRARPRGERREVL